MINSITDGIIAALKQAYPTHEVYTESVEQGLNPPCFFVRPVSPEVKHFMGKRYYRQHLFAVHFFPESENSREEINEVIEQLFQHLEQITVDEEPMRGTNMRTEISDDVLIFFVNYDLFVYKEQPPADLMTELTIERGLANGEG